LVVTDARRDELREEVRDFVEEALLGVLLLVASADKGRSSSEEESDDMIK
jgi:hypothetical protein